jgi:hypothetical protein
MALSMGVLVALILLLIWFIAFLWSQFAGLQKEVAAAILTASGTVIAAIVVAFIGKIWEKKLSIQQDIRSKKTPIYEEFVDFFMRVIFSSKVTGESVSEEEMLKYFSKLTPNFIAWGSDA